MQDAAPATLRDWSPAILSTAARELYPSGPWLLRMKQVYRPYICPFHRVLGHVPFGSSVLDVGCGGGLFLGLVHRAGRLARGVGFDSSARAINLASEMSGRATGRNCDILSFEHRAVDDPWPVGIFDVVSIIDVMHHVKPTAQRGLFEHAAEHVAPRGSLIYKDVGVRPRWRAWSSRLHDLVLAQEWIHLVPVAEIEQWATQAGFGLIHAESINQLWYGHELRVFRRASGAPPS